MRNALLLLVVIAAPAHAQAVRAEPVHAGYAAYAAGLNVVVMDAEFLVAPSDYRVHLTYRTTGALGLVIYSHQDTTVEGRFVADHAVPRRFYSFGVLRGEQRVTQIDYPAGQPSVRQLVPPNDHEREPVPPDRQANTIDTLSAMAQLMRRVNATGRCDGRVVTFDGRRLSELAASTAGVQVLQHTSRSSFSGPALRCDFEGRQLGGFKLGEDPDELRRPQHGSAWFASLTPDGAKVPVLISFHTPWFGQAMMYLRDPETK